MEPSPAPPPGLPPLQPPGPLPAEPETLWTKSAPWFLTVAATLCLVAIGLFLTTNVEWFKASAFPSEDSPVASAPDVSAARALSDPVYRLHLYHLHVSLVKRSVGLFTGFAVLFVGLGVAFYTLRTATALDLGAPTLTAKLATASPGLVAVVVGATILVATIASKDTFPPPPPGGFVTVDSTGAPLVAPLYPDSSFVRN